MGFRASRLVCGSMLFSLCFSLSASAECQKKREMFSCTVSTNFVRIGMNASYETLAFDDPQDVYISMSLRAKSDYLTAVKAMNLRDKGLFFGKLCNLPSSQIEFDGSENRIVWSIDCIRDDITAISVSKDFIRIAK